MKFSEFINACRGILERAGREKFAKARLCLHDVGNSSQFAQAVSFAGGVSARDGAVNIAKGGKPARMAEILAQAYKTAGKIGGDPDVYAAGDRTFVFGYDSLANTLVASYDIPKEDLVESILDRPRLEMDPAIWKDGPDGPELSEGAKQVIDAVYEWAVDRYGIAPSAGVRVVGSIASNSYSDESDVDIHFYGKDIDFGGKSKEDFNHDFKHAFKAFAAENQQYASIGGRPVEVYAQKNEFQDMTSVGCYDVKSQTWEAGPDVKDTAYDPYSDYYKADMEYAGSLVDDIRQAIMSVYEKASVFEKSSDPEFRKKIGGELMAAAKDAGALFKKIKGMRTAVSEPEPKSREEALAKRDDRRWHIADSAFKLLGKFGYIGVCKACRDAVEDGMGPAETARLVLDAVSQGIAKNASLPEAEREKWGRSLLGESDTVGGIPLMDRESAEADIKAFAEQAIENAGADAEIAEVWLHGSRMRGGWTNASDLDAVVFYRGGAKEDHLYNILNCSGETCDVCGVEVDFNPINVETD